MLCLEEHGTIGHPVQCAGLLSLDAFSECRISGRSILNRVSGAEVTTSLGSRLLIDAGTTKAFVVDRGILDREMAEAAAEAGADIGLKTAVYKLRDHVVVTRGASGHQEFGYKILVAADGPRSTIARLNGMERSPCFLAGIQADVVHQSDPRYVGIYPDASPEFFAWRIPINRERVRIGLAGLTSVKDRFSCFRSMFPGASVELVTGTIPLGVMPKTLRAPHPVCRRCGGFCETHVRRRGIHRYPERPACGPGRCGLCREGDFRRSCPFIGTNSGGNRTLAGTSHSALPYSV